MSKIKKFIGRCIFAVIALGCIIGIASMTINNHIVKSQKESILCAVNEEAQELASSDIEKLKDKGADCISGDNGTESHNEIHVMLNYVKKAGVPEADIFCDHAGFSTYDSMYRAKDIFSAQTIIVVTQTYHEYRALYIGDELGLDVYGAASDQLTYAGQPMREIREVMARVKDYFKVMGKPESVLGGEIIPISGSGVISHGE